MGLRAKLGDLGTKAIRWAQRTGRSLAETIGILEPAGITIEPEAAVHDWGHVSTADALSPTIAKLPDDVFVSHDLYTEYSIPLKRKYAYEVHILGRSAGRHGMTRAGTIAHQDFRLTADEELDIRQIKEMAAVRIGEFGTDPLFLEIWDVAVTGAYRSPDVEW